MLISLWPNIHLQKYSKGCNSLPNTSLWSRISLVERSDFRVCSLFQVHKHINPVITCLRISCKPSAPKDGGEQKMFGFFSKNPVKSLQKKHEDLLTKAFEAQRNGNIRLYSTLTAEAEVLRGKIEEHQLGENKGL
jgi:hypothetical protein